MNKQTLYDVLEEYNGIPSYLKRDVKKYSDALYKSDSSILDDEKYCATLRKRIKSAMGMQSVKVFDNYVKNNQ